ncbi:multidrug ABC transporter permease [Ktedonobacteria bacterium brp13]|nr:multidrug ABC transporter permease [Ktedonobacteria bacterium brp13]
MCKKFTIDGTTKKSEPEDESFQLRKVFLAFSGLPRVLSIVWSADMPLTLALAIVTIVRGLTPVIQVIITQVLIDRVVQGMRLHSIAPIWLPVGLQLGMSLVDRFLVNSSTTLEQLLRERVTSYIQLAILKKADTLDLAFFEDSKFYDTLREAATESGYKPVTMIRQTFELGQTLITLISMLFLLMQLAWWLIPIMFLLPIPSFIAGSRYCWREFYRMRHESPERRLMAYFNHVMTVDDYNKEIKLFSLGDFFIRRYSKLMDTFFAEFVRFLFPRSISNFLWAALTIIANSAIYLYVALRAVQGTITLGALTKYTQAAMRAGLSIQSILDGIADIYENTLYVSTLFEFLAYMPEITSPSQPALLQTATQPGGLEIEFRNVSFTYPGKSEVALLNVSFTIHSGEAIALVGRNGAGKTTLIKLLTRLYDPDDGEILIGGRNIREYDLHTLRAQIGVVFQDFVKYHLTASENIGLGRLASIDDLESVKLSAARSGADTVIEQLSDGYETMLGLWFKQGTQLSGGEWQKIALARAFMRDARILILDEPTSALDPQSEADIFKEFRVLTEDKTAIFISHRFSTVRLADRILVLEHGNVRECGSHKELMALNGRYAELFNLQAEAYRS